MKRLTLIILCMALLRGSEHFLAQTITGNVRDETTGKPAAGDEVLLLRLGGGMQQQELTKTNAQGAFSFSLPVATAQYVVRVWHQGVNYDQLASGAASLQITVFDAVSKVPGLHGSIGMAQLESDGKLLKVSEMYAISNTSKPPVTQSNLLNFPISLPPKAVLDSIEVKGPGGIWTNAPLRETPQESGHYNVSFPLRPGETLFRFVYHLRYKGPASFHLKLPYPIKKFAIMHPPSMTFTALQANTFRSPGVTSGLQIEQAVAEPLSREVPPFVISGTGVAQSPGTQPNATAQSFPASQVSPATSSQPRIAPLPSKIRLGMLFIGVAVLTAAVIFALRRTWRKSALPANASTAVSRPLIDALKEELFRLETERLRGSISAEKYASTKQALTLNIERALKHKR